MNNSWVDDSQMSVDGGWNLSSRLLAMAGEFHNNKSNILVSQRLAECASGSLGAAEIYKRFSQWVGAVFLNEA